MELHSLALQLTHAFIVFVVHSTNWLYHCIFAGTKELVLALGLEFQSLFFTYQKALIFISDVFHRTHGLVFRRTLFEAGSGVWLAFPQVEKGHFGTHQVFLVLISNSVDSAVGLQFVQVEGTRIVDWTSAFALELVSENALHCASIQVSYAIFPTDWIIESRTLLLHTLLAVFLTSSLMLQVDVSALQLAKIRIGDVVHPAYGSVFRKTGTGDSVTWNAFPEVVELFLLVAFQKTFVVVGDLGFATDRLVIWLANLLTRTRVVLLLGMGRLGLFLLCLRNWLQFHNIGRRFSV